MARVTTSDPMHRDPMHRLINLMNNDEQVMGDIIKHAAKRFEFNKNEINALDEDLLKATKEAQEAQSSASSWETWNSRLQYVNGFVFSSAGAYLIATGAVGPGAALLVPAAGSLLNRAISDLGGYKALAAWVTQSKEEQQKIATTCDFGISLSCSIASLAGGWAMQAFLLPQRYEVLNTITVIAKRTFPVLTGLTNIGKSKAEKATAAIRSSQEITKESKRALEHGSVQNVEQLGELMELKNRMIEITRGGIYGTSN